MVKLSIIIVAYRNMECLAACLASIPDLPWIEVIVVNNSHQNRGFSQGCNMGARIATGEYLLFLNPDCVVDEAALTRLVAILENDNTIGIVGPKLTDVNGNAYLSCNRPLSRSASPIVYSFLNRVLGKLPLVRDYWYHNKPPLVPTEVGSVCGAAMGMRKAVFDSVHGFDERFFLYWEEFDLAIRVSQKKYRIVFDPTIALIHEGELSTIQPRMQVMRWFRESRYYFFKKQFGRGYALFLEGWLTLSEEWRYLVGVLGILGFGLWFYRFGWWLGLGYLPFWEQWSVWGLGNISMKYWLGVAGALSLMTMVYNELNPTSRWKILLISVLIGIWAVMLPLGPLLLVLGGLWIIADLQKGLHALRKGLVVLSLVAVFLSSLLLIRSLTINQGFSASLSHWCQVLRVIEVADKPISIRCVGCSSPQELKPLMWLLADRGMQLVPSGGNLLYIFLPPFSLNKNLLPDAVTIRIGTIVLAWPLSSL